MRYPLITNRLRIEPLALSDVDQFVAYRSDHEIARYQTWDENYSREQALELLQYQEGVLLPARGDWLQLALHHHETGELVGDVALHALDGESKCFELGCTISRANQRKGFAREALTGVLDYLVADQGDVSFIGTPDSRNQASIGLLLSLGFIQDPSKSWIEEFKGETVTVYYFERT